MWFYFSLVVSAVLVLLDQSLKWWAGVDLTGVAPQVVVPHVVSLTSVKNYGAAWNLLTGRRIFLVLLASLVLVILVFYLWKCRFDLPYSLTLALLIAGTLGNLINRAVSGNVIDMIQLTFINFPVFNLADSCLTVGMAALLILLWVRPVREDPVK